MSPLCSRNARPKKALVGRAQWGTHPGHPWGNINEQAWKNHLWSLAAALLGKGASRRVRVGWVRSLVCLSSLQSDFIQCLDQ